MREATIARAIRQRAGPARCERSKSWWSTIARPTAQSRLRELSRKTVVRVVALEKNRGPGGARNAGFEAARGRWIAVLDSDDTVYPDRIARMISARRKADAQIVVDNLDVVPRCERRGGNDVCRATLLESFAELTLTDFISRQSHVRENILVRLHEADLRAAISSNGTGCAMTRRCASARIIFCSPRRWPRAGAASSSRNRAMPITCGQDPSRRVLELHHVAAMLDGRRDFHPRPSRSMRPPQAAQARRTRSLEEAAAFLALVQHLKDRAPFKAVGAALQRSRRACAISKCRSRRRLRRVARSFQRAGDGRTERPSRHDILDLGG